MPEHVVLPPSAVGDRAPQLCVLATMIDDAFADMSPGDPASVIRVIANSREPAEPQLGIFTLAPGNHVTDALLGFTAPIDFAGIGVVSTGRRYSPGNTGQEPVAVRLTLLLDRHGASVALVSDINGGFRPSAERRRLVDPPDGELADACRRVLGLPTSPPPEGLDRWLVARWLDRLLARAVAEPGGLTTWAQAAALHPLVGSDPPPDPEALAELAGATAETFGWENFRQMAAGGGGISPALDREVVAWMDAGFFARWLISSELPLPLLITELTALLPVELSASVAAAIRPSTGG